LHPLHANAQAAIREFQPRSLGADCGPFY
jgi:hypothetical protein